MMSADELRQRCTDLREKRAVADEELVAAIESDVDEYRAFLAEPRPQMPPDVLAERLPLIGWLIYEATWYAVQRVAPAFESLTGEPRAASDRAYGFIARVANAARSLPWPEFAPRALGSIRAQALAESKRDTESGYDAAWILHEEARTKHKSFNDSHAGKEPDDPNVLGLDEALLQLALAETGTACRTAERVIGRWTDELEREDPPWTADDDARWTQRMFRELSDGVSVGELALAVAERIEARHGLVRGVDEHRMALVTSFQNPGIMTARAALLMLAMCPEMQWLGRRPLDGESWDRTRAHLLTRFTRAYRAIERPVLDTSGDPLGPKDDHKRSVVQLRLNLALLVPGYDLPATLVFDPCLEVNPLNNDAVEAMSAWLAESVGGRQRGDANVIGSATKPSFIRSVAACRAEGGATGGYHEWRRRWFVLDRYANEPGRQKRVAEILEQTADGA